MAEKCGTHNFRFESTVYARDFVRLFQVTGLTPRKRYEFRVAAVNAAGQGDYSENSALITAQVEASRPRIQLSMLGRDIIAYAGQPAKVPFLY